MPRFFFDVTDGRYDPDATGTELPDVNAARAEAIQACGGMLRDVGCAFWKESEWFMEVKDEAHRPLFSLRMSGIERGT